MRKLLEISGALEARAVSAANIHVVGEKEQLEAAAEEAAKAEAADYADDDETSEGTSEGTSEDTSEEDEDA